jgi:hypothetical protein
VGSGTQVANSLLSGGAGTRSHTNAIASRQGAFVLSDLAVGWVLRHSATRDSLRLLLVVLAHYATDAGEGRLRRGKVARNLGLEIAPTEDHKLAVIDRALEALAEQGAIDLDPLTPRPPRPNGRRRKRPNSFGYKLLYPGNDPAWVLEKRGTATADEMGRSGLTRESANGGSVTPVKEHTEAIG